MAPACELVKVFYCNTDIENMNDNGKTGISKIMREEKKKKMRRKKY